MTKKVNWIVLEEEFTVGFAGDIFITEECVRFDAPRVMIHENLYEAMAWVLNYDSDDADEDERQFFSEQLDSAREAYVEAKKKIVMKQFMKKRNSRHIRRTVSWNHTDVISKRVRCGYPKRMTL